MIVVTAAIVVIAAGIVVITPTAALVLLSWPHRSLTWILLILMIMWLRGLSGIRIKQARAATQPLLDGTVAG
ncbi:hypothetical protein OIU34_37925 [Pararhizobium sp. BT-229]|uniref:hypothetical protein n=1 Tax=Pararhizobium sp. BT-229 TaxID=2986923 RepID=UPI0021F6F92C|nr:hypothetical protein [Pararhizobium sp. BT-229]MCV9967608.1 hypothetical protein [Pararhizobium sp. BT-229]